MTNFVFYVVSVPDDHIFCLFDQTGINNANCEEIIII